MACKLCEKLKAKMQSKSIQYMGNSNDMVKITNGKQTRECARSFFEQYCTKTWKIVEKTPTEEPKEPEPKEVTETEVKTKKKK